MAISKIIWWALAWFIGTTMNFGIFLASYKYLTFPYLHEEQRVENAPYIFGYVLPAIMVASLITVILFWGITRIKHNKSN